MMVFEILFKNSFILDTPALIVMHSLNEKGSPKLSYAKSIFNSSRCQLGAKFSRFSVLENVSGICVANRQASDHYRLSDDVRSRDEDSESVGAESVESVMNEDGIVNKIRQGIFRVESDEVEATSNMSSIGKPIVCLPESQSQKGYFVTYPSSDFSQICLFDVKRYFKLNNFD